MGGWITLDSIIHDYMNEAELSENKYFKLYNLAFRCMESLGLDFFYQVKSVKVAVNANKTVTLPDDFMQYTKLGVLNGAGELIPLKYNTNLTNLNDLHADRLAGLASSNALSNYYSPSSSVFFNYWNGSSYSNLYGVDTTGIYGGGFKIDQANGVILLDPSFGYDNLVLEYTASPRNDQDYHVPAQFRETIIAWLSWKDVLAIHNVRKIGSGEKQARRHDYFEARRVGIAQYKPFYLDQAYMVSQEASKLVVKS